MKRALALLAVAGLLVAVAAGCGGDDEPEASSDVAWAEDLCSAVTTWTDELERIGDEITDISSLSGDAIREAGSDLEAATETFLDDVRSLGRPDTEAGDEAQRLLEGLADTIEAEKQAIEDAVDEASGITGITSAVSTIASSLTTMGQEFQRTFDELGELDATGELESAFDQAAACERFTSS